MPIRRFRGASAGGGRRTSKLGGMPGARNGPDLLDDDRAAQRDQDDDDGGRRRDRARRVQRDAEGAMVGFGVGGVDVRDLAERQQQQQEQAQHRGGDGICVATPAFRFRPGWSAIKRLYPFPLGYTVLVAVRIEVSNK